MADTTEKIVVYNIGSLDDVTVTLKIDTVLGAIFAATIRAKDNPLEEGTLTFALHDAIEAAIADGDLPKPKSTQAKLEPKSKDD